MTAALRQRDEDKPAFARYGIVKDTDGKSGHVMRAKASGTRLVSGSNANPQRFVFPGPKDNGFSCDVAVADGKVVYFRD